MMDTPTVEIDVDVTPPPDDLRVVPFGAGTSQVLWHRGGSLIGWVLAENSGAGTASVTLYDGLDNNGTLIGKVGLASGESHIVPPVGPGWPLKVGLHVSIQGNVLGSVVVTAPPT